MLKFEIMFVDRDSEKLGMQLQLRFRNLAKSKAYREAVAKWGESEKATRKRVIIAPRLMNAGETREVTLGTDHGKPTVVRSGRVSEPQSRGLSTQTNVSSDDNTLSSYTTWIEERKALREDLDQCGKVHDWLASKPCLSEIEQRVHEVRPLQPLKVKPEHWDKSRKENNNEDNIRDHCGSKYPPSISQPLPAILATINDYLAKKRLRMYDLFVLADRDKDWKITREEFRDIMRKAGIPIKDYELDQLIAALDENNNDVLEYKELVHGRDMFIINERARKHSDPEVASLPHNSVELSDNIIDTEIQLPELVRQTSSQSLLCLPDMQSSSEMALMQNQDKEKRMKKQKKRDKHRNRTKGNEKTERRTCTMGGVTGLIVDRFREQKQKEFERILELCHLHGVRLSRNMLERVLIHPEDRSLDVCVSSLKHPNKYLPSEEQLYRQLAPSSSDVPGKRFTKQRRQSSFHTYYVYPPAASVMPKNERMTLSSGPATISRKADCWMTYEEYNRLTRHLDSRFEKRWKPSDDNAYWPSYVFDKVRLYLDRPRTQARSENSIFEVVHNRTIH